jgi:AraC-like DNA-binding protein
MRVVRAKLYIDTHFSRPIDLDNIADEACFSKFHFARLFRTIYGKTPHQYLTEVRVERARNLLAEGSTVAAACFGVGFDSISSFTGLFKRRTGLTPAAYQREALERQAAIEAQPAAFVPNCFAENHGWNE